MNRQGTKSPFFYSCSRSHVIVIHRQPRPQAPPRFYLTAVEKNREKAWDQNYVTTGNGGLGYYVMWTRFRNDGNVPTHNAAS